MRGVLLGLMSWGLNMARYYAIDRYYLPAACEYTGALFAFDSRVERDSFCVAWGAEPVTYSEVRSHYKLGPGARFEHERVKRQSLVTGGVIDMGVVLVRLEDVAVREERRHGHA